MNIFLLLAQLQTEHSVPTLKFAGITLARTSTGEAQNRFGKAVSNIGQHPNSRYCWVLKDGLTIEVDGWNVAAKHQGYIVDLIAVSNWKGTLEETLAKSGLTPSFALLGKIRVGMSPKQVEIVMGTCSVVPHGTNAYSEVTLAIKNDRNQSSFIVRFNWDRRSMLTDLSVRTANQSPEHW